MRFAWRTDPAVRIIAAVALVVTGCGVVFGLSALDFAFLVVAATVVVVALVVRASFAAGADIDEQGFRAFAIAAHIASGAVVAALAGAAVVIVLVFGARLFSALR